MSTATTDHSDAEAKLLKALYPSTSRTALTREAKFIASLYIWNDGKYALDADTDLVAELIADLPKQAVLDDLYDDYFDELGAERIWDLVVEWQEDLDCSWEFAVTSFFLRVLEIPFYEVFPPHAPAETEDFEKKIRKALWSADERAELSGETDYKAESNDWNSGHYNATSEVGEVMDILRKLPAGSSIEDAYAHYFSVSDMAVIHAVIKRWQKALDSDFAYAVNTFCKRVIDDTLAGAKGEMEAMEMLRKDIRFRGYKFRYATPDEDAKFGVDIVCSSSGVITHAFQIKPGSYFGFTKKNLSLIEARTVINPAKYDKFVAANPKAKVFYINLDDMRARKAISVIPVADVAEGIYFG